MTTFITPPNFVAGTVVTEADLDALSTDITVLTEALQNYTPVLSNWTLGNGTLTGKARLANKRVEFEIYFTFGSTSVAAGTLTFSLPVSAVPATNVGEPLDGIGWVFDTSASAQQLRFPTITTSGTVVHLRDTAGTLVSPATPYTWATGDRIIVKGSYEAA